MSQLAMVAGPLVGFKRVVSILMPKYDAVRHYRSKLSTATNSVHSDHRNVLRRIANAAVAKIRRS
jgi:t-SNARE complex subunit (syntaxin)